MQKRTTQDKKRRENIEGCKDRKTRIRQLICTKLLRIHLYLQSVWGLQSGLVCYCMPAYLLTSFNTMSIISHRTRGEVHSDQTSVGCCQDTNGRGAWWVSACARLLHLRSSRCRDSRVCRSLIAFTRLPGSGAERNHCTSTRAWHLK